MPLSMAWACDSCALYEISNLGVHKDASDAMKEICAILLGVKNGFVKKYGLMPAFVVYCSGPEVPKNAPGGSFHSKAWVKYGSEFTSFIEKHGLGSVATLPRKPNMKHHPTTTAQVWIWSPRQEAVECWWDAQPESRDERFSGKLNSYKRDYVGPGY